MNDINDFIFNLWPLPSGIGLFLFSIGQKNITTTIHIKPTPHIPIIFKLIISSISSTNPNDKHKYKLHLKYVSA